MTWIGGCKPCGGRYLVTGTLFILVRRYLKAQTTANDCITGHCWSDESRFPPLRNISLRLPSGHMASTALHPASAPKCTHAYVLSRTGARRIVAHLRHPPFAYSRAIDQALSWLVQSRRLRVFSIVPPVVVQRKISGSDVMPGLGSAWRSRLYGGVLGFNEQTKKPILSRQET